MPECHRCHRVLPVGELRKTTSGYLCLEAGEIGVHSRCSKLAAAAIEPGQRWRHRREHWREIVVQSKSQRGDGDVDIYVRRNTSRRRQAIKATTLIREYELRTAA